ncbi:MAG TPA: hypothetical protein VF173_24765 [Thermoanaerobaculia bacterium]|nr:hypothetical protein [Thermoanaerobaculia bacterium]
MTCKRLRLAAAVLLGLALLTAPAAQALPGISGVEARSVPVQEEPGFFAGLWNHLARLLPIFDFNRAGIDPNGAQAAPGSENRIGIDPDGAQVGSDNRISIDPNG